MLFQLSNLAIFARQPRNAGTVRSEGMPSRFVPDIVVTVPEESRVALVVEAKTHLPNLARTEDALKEYMIGMQCPVGLLVTPERLWIYRDAYLDRSPQSIKRIGEYATIPLWREAPPTEPRRFEVFVQRWLERLPEEPTSSLPAGLGEALREYVIPAVNQGEVRAAQPRWSRHS